MSHLHTCCTVMQQPPGTISIRSLLRAPPAAAPKPASAAAALCAGAGLAAAAPTAPDAAFAFHKSLCEFVLFLRELVPTATCSELRATVGAEWATGLLVAAHSTDEEDVLLLAQKRGLTDCVSTVVDDSKLMSAAYPELFGRAYDAGSGYYRAKEQLARFIAIGDGARSELAVIESEKATALWAQELEGALCLGLNAGSPLAAVGSPQDRVASPALPPKSSSCAAAAAASSALPLVLPELWVCVPPAGCARMSRKASLLQRLLPGIVIRVCALLEESLLQHFPDIGLGRLRVSADTTMVSDAPGHPVSSAARIAATSRIGTPYMRTCTIDDTRLPSMPEAIKAGASRSCSMGAGLQIGEGAASSVAFVSSGHDLELSLIGSVSLEVSRAAVDEQDAAPRDGIALHALACVNPGLLSQRPMPCGNFIDSLRAEPGSSADLVEPLRDATATSRIASDVALYGLDAGPDVPPHAAADMELLPHLTCSLPVRERLGIASYPCLPPFSAYSGRVLMTGCNVAAGPGPRQLDVIGYAVKVIDVPDPYPGSPTHTKAVKVVTFVAAPAAGIAPYERDSGGGVYTIAPADGSFVLHSFVSARAVLTDPSTGVKRELYTLTPAHLALEQVRALQEAPGSSLPQGPLKFVRPRRTA